MNKNLVSKEGVKHLLLLVLLIISLYAEGDYYPGQLIGDWVVIAPDRIVVHPITPPTRISEVRLLGLSSHKELTAVMAKEGGCDKKPLSCSGSGGYYPFQETYQALFTTNHIIRNFCQDPEGIWFEWLDGEAGILRCKTPTGIFDINTMILMGGTNNLKEKDLKLLDTRSKLLWSALMPFFQAEISEEWRRKIDEFLGSFPDYPVTLEHLIDSLTNEI
jgi:hypothetical protein